jgi:hypothetical protein
MSYHQYYSSLPTTILHEIYVEINNLKNQSGAGDNTVINNKIDNLIMKINNKTYYDEYFKPNLGQEGEKVSLSFLLSRIDIFSAILLFPFFSGDMITVLANYFTANPGFNLNADKIRNTFRYYGKLVFTNVDPEDENYNSINHYVMFWMFNNIDFSKSYDNDTFLSISHKCYDELKALCETCYGIIVNEDTNNNNFTSLIQELQKNITLINYSTVINYLGEFVNDVFGNYGEDGTKTKNQLKIYINLCMASKVIFTGVSKGIPNEQVLELGLIEEMLENNFNPIIGREHDDPSPEELLHMFNLNEIVKTSN